MLKIYRYNGYTFQYEEGKEPAGAVEVKQAKTQNKARTAQNKSRTTRKKVDND